MVLKMARGARRMAFGKISKYDRLVKSLLFSFFVIPAKAGIY